MLMILTAAGITCRMGEGNTTVTVDAEKLTNQQVERFQQLVMQQFAYLQANPDRDAG